MTRPIGLPRWPAAESFSLNESLAAGAIVLVDWRDKHFPSEPGKTRPAIVIVNSPLLASVGVMTVLPLSGAPTLALPSLSVCIEPSPTNGMTKPSFALVWSVQTVAMKRVKGTTTFLSVKEIDEIKGALAAFLAV